MPAWSKCISPTHAWRWLPPALPDGRRWYMMYHLSAPSTCSIGWCIARVLRAVHEVGRQKHTRKHLLVEGYPRVGVRLVGRIYETDGGREAPINSLMRAKNGCLLVGISAGQYGVTGRFGRLVFPWFGGLIPCGPWCSLGPVRIGRQ